MEKMQSAKYHSTLFITVMIPRMLKNQVPARITEPSPHGWDFLLKLTYDGGLPKFSKYNDIRTDLQYKNPRAYHHAMVTRMSQEHCFCVSRNTGFQNNRKQVCTWLSVTGGMLLS